MPFNLEIVTPEQKIFNNSATKLILPSTSGQITILSHHAPLFSTLTAGTVYYWESTGKKNEIQIGKGMVEVKGNKIVLLIEPPNHSEEAVLHQVKTAKEMVKKIEMGKPKGEIPLHKGLTRSVLDVKNIKRKKKHPGFI